MPEEYDLSDVLDKPSQVSNAAKEKTNFKIKLGLGIGIIVVTAAVITGGLSDWFAVNDFNKSIALSENVSRWTSPSWAYGDDVRKIENKFGDWTRTEPQAPFVNADLGCVIRLTEVGGPEETLDTDKAATVVYTDTLTGDQADAETKSAWVEVSGGKTGKVELLKTRYNTAAGTPAVAYYRNSVEPDSVIVGVVACDSQESLDKVAPFSSDGEELTKLGITVEP